MSQKRQIKKLGAELKQILKEEPTNRLMSQELTSQEVTLLVSAINQLLLANRKHARLYQEEAETLQQSLTHLSHDLRTPLASIEGYLQLLGESETPEDSQRYQAILKERMTHTRRLMDQYFLSLKYASQDFAIPLTALDPNELFLQCLLSFAPALEAKEWEPELELFSGPVMVMAHQESLYRVYQNLIQNALTHGADFLKIESKLEVGQYILTISNGLKPELKPDLDRIFDRFYKADSVRTVQSTGLGLSIVKSLVTHLKGTIESHSQEGVFSLTLTLPITTD